MKNMKISNDVHGQIKEISNGKGITMDGVLRKLLEVVKAESSGSNTVPEPITTTSEAEKAESPGSNTVQKRDTTTYHQAENHQSKNKEEEVENMERIDKNELQALIDEALQKREAKKQEKRDFKGIKSAVEDLQAKFCAGDVCFLTKNELDVYLEKHSKDIADQVKTSIEGLKATLDVAEQARGLAEEAKKPALSPMNEEIRLAMTEEESSERDKAVASLADKMNLTYVDMHRQLKNSPEDYRAVKRHAVEDLSDKELLDLFSTCTERGDCPVFFGELRSRGLNVQIEKDGRWSDLAEPEKKKREVF